MLLTAVLPTLEGSTGPKYRRICDALKAAIRDGRLGQGARLPSTRALAADLGVSRNTVLLAYEQLAAEGYLAGRERSATSVADAVPAASTPKESRTRGARRPRLSAYGQRLAQSPGLPPAGSYEKRAGIRYDFRYGVPPVHEFPHAAWRRLLAARARLHSAETTGYGPPGGFEPLREALAAYLGRARGVRCDAEQIVIVNGAQQGFDLIARVLLDVEDTVVVENPHYPGSSLPFQAVGARLLGLPVDGQGLDTSRLPVASAGARLACVTPCHQFPTGVVMPLSRRLALLEWAARTDAWVVEDDYVSEFRYEGQPLEALQSLDREGRVIHVGTFSKTLLPALRLAYLVLPRRLVQPFLVAKWMADRYTALLGQEALAEFLAGGQFERYLRRARARNGARRAVLVESLREHLGDRVEFSGANAGVHLLVWLKDRSPRELPAMVTRAATAGVGLYSITPYYLEPPRCAGLLFGYAALTEAEIRAGIRCWASVL